MISVTVLSVSEGELRRLEVLRDVERGGLPVSAAAQLLGRSERQVWRLLKAFRSDGVSGLISKKRGRPSNRKIVAAVRAAVLWIVRQNYADFGPTLAAEKLAGEHGFAFSSETLRKWMIEDGLWLDRKQRQKRVHQPRPRRARVGELVPVDGSEHWWFEELREVHKIGLGRETAPRQVSSSGRARPTSDRDVTHRQARRDVAAQR